MSFVEVIKASLREIAAPEFRRLMLRTILLSITLLTIFGGVAIWATTTFILHGTPVGGLVEAYPWATGVIYLLVASGTVVVLFAVIQPVLRFVAGGLVDQFAAIVEKNQEARLPARRDGGDTFFASIRFAVRTFALNIALLPVAIVPVIGTMLVFAANGYIVGREYYALASNRYRDPPETEARRRRRRLVVWAGGLVIVALSATPFFNVLAPAFGVSLMLKIDRRLMGEDRPTAAA